MTEAPYKTINLFYKGVFYSILITIVYPGNW